jgi:hypothetical protein
VRKLLSQRHTCSWTGHALVDGAPALRTLSIPADTHDDALPKVREGAFETFTMWIISDL